MIDIQNLIKEVKAYEENNAEMIKENNNGTFYGIDYFGGNVDDAFESGCSYGEYIAKKEIIERNTT